MARGLDVPNVEYVVSYDVTSVNNYIHRIGRTARAGKPGTAVSLVTRDTVSHCKVGHFSFCFLKEPFPCQHSLWFPSFACNLKLIQYPLPSVMSAANKLSTGDHSTPSNLSFAYFNCLNCFYSCLNSGLHLEVGKMYVNWQWPRRNWSHMERNIQKLWPNWKSFWGRNSIWKGGRLLMGKEWPRNRVIMAESQLKDYRII